MGTKKKLVTLEEFVKAHGSQRAAAAALGEPEPTINRWLRRKMMPERSSMRWLYQRGIDIRALGATQEEFKEIAAIVESATAR